MKKHEELITKYAAKIEAVKAAKAKAESLRDEAAAYDAATDLENYDNNAAMSLARKWEGANYEYGTLQATLREDIEIEYHDVPYAKPRQQGIAAFFAAAEL